MLVSCSRTRPWRLAGAARLPLAVCLPHCPPTVPGAVLASALDVRSAVETMQRLSGMRLQRVVQEASGLTTLRTEPPAPLHSARDLTPSCNPTSHLSPPDAERPRILPFSYFWDASDLRHSEADLGRTDVQGTDASRPAGRDGRLTADDGAAGWQNSQCFDDPSAPLSVPCPTSQAPCCRTPPGQPARARRSASGRQAARRGTRPRTERRGRRRRAVAAAFNTPARTAWPGCGGASLIASGTSVSSEVPIEQ